MTKSVVFIDQNEFLVTSTNDSVYVDHKDKYGKIGLKITSEVLSNYEDILRVLYEANFRKIDPYSEQTLGMIKFIGKQASCVSKVITITVDLEKERKEHYSDNHKNTLHDELVVGMNFSTSELVSSIAAVGVTIVIGGTFAAPAVVLGLTLIGTKIVASMLYDESGASDFVKDVTRAFLEEHGIRVIDVHSVSSANFSKISMINGSLRIELATGESMAENLTFLRSATDFLTQEYQIKSGDTLSSIAKKYNTTFEEILRLNPKIADPDLIYTNQNLAVPSDSTYIYKPIIDNNSQTPGGNSTLSVQSLSTSSTVNKSASTTSSLQNQQDLLKVDQNIFLPQQVKKVEVLQDSVTKNYTVYDNVNAKDLITNGFNKNSIKNFDDVVNKKIFVTDEVDGQVLSLVEDQASAIMGDNSIVDLNQLVGTVNAQIENVSNYVNMVIAEQLKSLFSISLNENQVVSDYDRMIAEIVNLGKNAQNNLSKIAEQVLFKNLKNDLAEKLIDRPLNEINEAVKKATNVDLAASIDKINKLLNSNVIEQEIRTKLLETVKTTISSNGLLQDIEQKAKDLGVEINLDDFVASGEVELVVNNYVMEKLGKKIFDDIKSGTIAKIDQITDLDIKNLVAAVSNQDLEKLAKDSAVSYINQEFQNAGLQTQLDNLNEQVKKSLGVDISKIDDLANRYFLEKDVVQMAKNIITDSIGYDLVDKIAAEQTNNANNLIKSLIGVDVKQEINNITNYLASGQGQMLQGGIAAATNLIMDGVIRGNLGAAVEKIAGTEVRSLATNIVKNTVTDVAKSFGASKELAGNVAGATVEVFNMFADGNISAEEILQNVAGRVVGSIATALIQAAFPFLPPFLSSTLGSFVGNMIAGLFGGAPLPPPPPLTITEAKADGSGNITYITKDSGGYSLQARAGSADDLVGGDNDDVLVGSNIVNKLYGQKGDDMIDGKEGDDIIIGGDGMDKIQGGAGNDVIDGGAGSDEIYGDIVENYGEGNDVISGGSGDDVIYGGKGDDKIEGGDDSDEIYGGD